MSQEKACSKCKAVKPLDEFRQKSGHRDGKDSQCKVCVSANDLRYRLANPRKIKEGDKKYKRIHHEAYKAYRRKYAAANPVSAEDARIYLLKKKYGMSLADYHEMLLRQGGACLICERVARLVIDHDHSTGTVRGLLCPQCNAALGLFRDSEQSLVSAAAYIRTSKVRAVAA